MALGFVFLASWGNLPNSTAFPDRAETEAMTHAEQLESHRGERERLRETIRMIDDGRLSGMFRPMGGQIESRSWEYRCHLQGVIGDLDCVIDSMEADARKG